MSAPVIWIGLPGIMSLVLWYFRRNERKTLFWGLGFSLFLIITSLITHVDKAFFQIGSTSFQINSSLTILGRTFSFGNGDLIIVSLLFIILFLFTSMAFVIDVPIKFVPTAFLIVSLFLAALSVQPFLYAALILEICVILAVVLFTDFGSQPSKGVLRFIIYQTLALPFILTSGWVLSAIEANPTETKLIIQALILLGLGFSFWVGVFPFNSWMPQIASEKPPFEVGFILLMFNIVVLVLIMRYLDGFVWLRDDAKIFTVLRILGFLMTITGSLFFLMEENIYRTTAYIISFETGLSILSLSLNKATGWDAFVLMFLPRILAVSQWSMLLSFIQQNEINKNEEEKIINPLILFGFAIASLTLAGLPLLPAFPSRLLLLTELIQINPLNIVWLMISNVLLIAAIIKFLRNISFRVKTWSSIKLPIVEEIYHGLFLGIIIIIGIFPQFFLQSMLAILGAFPNLK